MEVIIWGLTGYGVYLLLKAIIRRMINRMKGRCDNADHSPKVMNSSTPKEYVPDDPSHGIFQMLSFPYSDFEMWKKVFRQSAADANDALEIQKSNGVEWSLLDLMNDTQLKDAFEHHLDPALLGAYAGKTFDIRNVQFEDGVTTGEFVHHELLVRSHVFLSCLESGRNTEQARQFAFALSSHSLAEFVEAAEKRVESQYAGNVNAMIDDAATR